MAVTKAYKVYGWNRHRQKESFNKSYKCDFSDEKVGTRIITVLNSDITGTNDYSLVIITRDTEMECNKEMSRQLFDGIFENYRVGGIELVDLPMFN